MPPRRAAEHAPPPHAWSQAMKVQDLMVTPVTTCRPDDSLHHAAQLMWDNDLGSLPVCTGEGGGHVAGMITDRDICMSACLQRRPLLDMKVRDAMATQVRVCRSSDPIEEAERIMSEAMIRRLPVVDRHGSLVGIIALADLAREAAREQHLQSRRVTGNDVGMTLASICRRPDLRQGA
jgi:CBS domain-containing protein